MLGAEPVIFKRYCIRFSFHCFESMIFHIFTVTLLDDLQIFFVRVAEDSQLMNTALHICQKCSMYSVLRTLILQGM